MSKVKSANLVDVRIFFDDSKILNYLKLPLKERKPAFLKKRKQQLDYVLQNFEIQNLKIGTGRVGAPNVLRGLVSNKDLVWLKRTKGLITLPIPQRRKRPVPVYRSYHALLRIKDSTEGLRERSYFYMTVLVKAKDGRSAMKQINEIAKSYNGVSIDSKFRKVTSKAEVQLIEGCETQWGDKKPDHLVIIRTAQKNKNEINLKQLIEQRVLLY